MPRPSTSWTSAEVLNVVAGEGPRRVERHERGEAWRRRMLRHGFRARDLSPLADTLSTHLELAAPFAIVPKEGALLLTWKGQPIVAASSWS